MDWRNSQKRDRYDNLKLRYARNMLGKLPQKCQFINFFSPKNTLKSLKKYNFTQIPFPLSQRIIIFLNTLNIL